MNVTTPSPVTKNLLVFEASPYLRSASRQPVFWYPWGEEAFAVAQRENKPILLDIGAVWCHWCHVMDSESYENEDTAGIINANFVAIKVDRDERPDVDSRYQAAVSAISGQGGWPLTVFLTPKGQAYYGGTYFPPEDRYGRPGFPKVLELLAEAFRNEPEKIHQNAEQITLGLQNRLSRTNPTSVLSESVLETALTGILELFDERHGGFGSAPKFPHCTAIELLLASYDRANDPRMLRAVTTTLRAMGNGGVHDQLGGGFHRYSTDDTWMVPHFEKMLYDNAALLTNYVHAFQATNEPFFRDVAVDIARFVKTILSDSERGGFFSSQDADVAPGDDGSYFTWSLAELKKLLDDAELNAVRRHFGITETGPMHGDPTQNVLHCYKNPEEIALELQKPVSEIATLINSSRQKMQAMRSARRAPFVDKTMYADWNGMMICAYFEAFKAFHDEEMLQFALKTLNRILAEHRKNDGTISHKVVALSTEGFLADQVEIARALLQAFEVTSEQRYLQQAVLLIDQTLKNFADHEHGGFFDTPFDQPGFGLLSVATKPVHDSPVESANSIAIVVLIRLWALTGRSVYGDFVERSLHHCLGVVGNSGIFAANLVLALEEFLHPPPHIVVVSVAGDNSGKELFNAAINAYRPGKIVARYEPSALDTLPAVLRTSMKSYLRPVAFVCSQFRCAPPAYDPAVLRSTIQTFGRN